MFDRGPEHRRRERAKTSITCPNFFAIYRQRGLGVETITVSNPEEIRGINSPPSWRH